MRAQLRRTQSTTAVRPTGTAARRAMARVVGALAASFAIILLWGGTAEAESKPSLLGTVQGLLDTVGGTVDQTLATVDQTVGALTGPAPKPADEAAPAPTAAPVAASPAPSEAATPQPPTGGPVTQITQQVVAPVTDSVAALEPAARPGSTALHLAGQVDQLTSPVLEPLAPVTEPVFTVGSGLGRELAAALFALAPVTDPIDDLLSPVTDLTDTVVTGLTPVVASLDPVVDALTPLTESLAPVTNVLVPVADDVAPNVDGGDAAPEAGQGPGEHEPLVTERPRERGRDRLVAATRELAPAPSPDVDSARPHGVSGPPLTVAHVEQAPDEPSDSFTEGVGPPSRSAPAPVDVPATDGIPFSPTTTTNKGGDAGTPSFEGFVGAAPTNPRCTATSAFGTHRSDPADAPGRLPGFAPD